MLSSVALNCQVILIVKTSGSQSSEMSEISHKFTSHVMFLSWSLYLSLSCKLTPLIRWYCWGFWCTDAVDAAYDAVTLLMLWCCWYADAADALLLMHRCTALMRWCCSCADVADTMMLLMCQCWCVSSHTLQCTGADALMTMVWLQNNSVILKEILKVAKSQRFQWFVRFWKIFLQQGYEATEVTGYAGQNDSVIFKEILRFSKLQRFQWFFKFWKIFF